MEVPYIENLIREGEHQQQDFKFEISNARKIAKSLVAFANTDGGRLLIGVKDNGRIAGVRTEEEYYMIDAAATLYCKPEIPFSTFRHVVDGKVVLEIIIEHSIHRPHLARDEDNRWKAYHRVNDQNILADYILLQVWKREKRPRGTFVAYSEKEKRIIGFLELHDRLTFSEIKQALRLPKKEVQHILINLICFQVISMEFEESETYYSLTE